jgi:hypothetical protein
VGFGRGKKISTNATRVYLQTGLPGAARNVEHAGRKNKNIVRWQEMNPIYTVSVYVNDGPQCTRERMTTAANALRRSGSGSALLGQNGHVFVELSNGRINTYLGFYGNPPSQGGPIRIEPYLAEQGWNVKKTYPISLQGYHAAFQIVERWNTDGRHWAAAHHCGDFAEAVVRAAGVDLVGLPCSVWAGHRPGLWAVYLKSTGGQRRQ